MAKVLLFNIESGKGIKIKNICRKLYIDYEDVEKERFGCTMGALLGLDENVAASDGADFDEELLYLADIDGGMLSILLSQLRLKKVPVALKAVKTDVNLGYTANALYRELSAEREAIAKGTQAH